MNPASLCGHWVIALIALASPLFAALPGSPDVPRSHTGPEESALTNEEKINHVMNRLAYGPSVEDLDRVHSIGLAGYIQEQLTPESIDESIELACREAELFTAVDADRDTRFAQGRGSSGSGSSDVRHESIAPENPALGSRRRIRDIRALQQLIHLRGVYSRSQLQAVLAEFWENHFTTDYDKVVDYLLSLRNSDGEPAMSESQAAREAAQLEHLEYDFFYRNAFGHFGDLLLFSATSPSQLIYLDTVLNIKNAPNENYARELLELFAFGVDNRYTKQDIEQLSKCLTGWTVRKIHPEEQQAFPACALRPPTLPGVSFDRTVLLEVGRGWKFSKGIREPSPASNGTPATAWAEPGFDDSAWLDGATSIGYGDDDDATVLADMRNNYVSVYLRRLFTVEDPSRLEVLLLTVAYNDGFVAYLNGQEVGRSQTMLGTGTPPAFNRTAEGSHHADEPPEEIDLSPFLSLLCPAPEKNVLALQVHNVTSRSSDLSIHPRLIDVRKRVGSVENGDRNGVWTFRFDPDTHDTSAKVVFADTPCQIDLPADRTGAEGLRDALDVIDSFVSHPSVREFICLKLMNKFVSDEITLTSYRDGTAPEGLRRLLDDAISAWQSTSPPGDIRTVMRTILKPIAQDGYFWTRSAYRVKVKTPVEFVNSSLRALGADVSGTTLPQAMETLGMHFFTRDEPNGWSENAVDWVDTNMMLERIKFAQALAENRLQEVSWDVASFVESNQLSTADSIVVHFERLVYADKMPSTSRRLLVEFATTDEQGEPLPLVPSRGDYHRRVSSLIGLMLSMPQWHYQ